MDMRKLRLRTSTERSIDWPGMVGERRCSHHVWLRAKEIGMRVCACGVDSNPHCRLPNESCWDAARLGGVYVRRPYMLGAEAPSNDNWWNELQRAPANDLRDRDR